MGLMMRHDNVMEDMRFRMESVEQMLNTISSIMMRHSYEELAEENHQLKERLDKLEFLLQEN
jgi:cell shape-determining protein MreC